VNPSTLNLSLIKKLPKKTFFLMFGCYFNP
jgi:hypothetical protein